MTALATTWMASFHPAVATPRLLPVTAILYLFAGASMAQAQGEAVIPPGQDAVVGQMLAGEPASCTFAGASVERDHVLARYRCSGDLTEVELRHVGDSTGAVETTRSFSLRAAPGQEALVRAVAEGVRRHEGSFRWNVREPEPTQRQSTEQPMELGEPWAPLLLLLLVVGLGWRFPRRMLPVVLVGVAVGVALLVRASFDQPVAALLWLALPAAVLFVIPLSVRREPRAMAAAAGLFVLAALFRAIAPTRIANWYVDLLGPLSEGAPFMRRPGGWAGAFALLDGLVRVDPSWVFLSNVIASSIAVALLALAVHVARVGGRVAWPPGTAWVLGLLLAIDPTLVAVGATDAPHSVALLGVAIAAFGYSSAASSARPERFVPSIFIGAALAGLTRPDMTLAPLLCLALAWPRRSNRSTVLALLAGVAVAAALWVDRDLGAARRALSWARGAAWLATRLEPLVGVHNGRGLRDGLVGLDVVLGMAVWALAVFALARRRWHLLVPLPTLLVIEAPRLLTDFYRGSLNADLPTSRYLMVPLVAWWLLAAAGACAMWEARPRNHGSAAVRGALAMILALVATMAAVVLVRPAGGPELSYQREYRMLAEELPRLPPDSVVFTHFLDHFPSRQRDPDLALAHPHPLLTFTRRDVRVRLLDLDDEPPRGPRHYYFRSSLCGLDPDRVGRSGPEDARAAERVVRACSAATENVTTWRARDEAAVDLGGTLRPHAWIGLGVIRGR